MENLEQVHNPLVEVYRKVHGKEPVGLDDLQMIKNTMEVVYNKNWIQKELRDKYENYIKTQAKFPDSQTKEKILVALEDFKQQS